MSIADMHGFGDGNEDDKLDLELAMSRLGSLAYEEELAALRAQLNERVLRHTALDLVVRTRAEAHEVLKYADKFLAFLKGGE